MIKFPRKILMGCMYTLERQRLWRDLTVDESDFVDEIVGSISKSIRSNNSGEIEIDNDVAEAAISALKAFKDDHTPKEHHLPLIALVVKMQNAVRKQAK